MAKPNAAFTLSLSKESLAAITAATKQLKEIEKSLLKVAAGFQAALKEGWTTSNE